MKAVIASMGYLVAASGCALTAGRTGLPPDGGFALREDVLIASLEEMEDVEETADEAARIEQISQLMAEPLSLNGANASDLATLPWVSPLIGERIERYRRLNGPFAALDELLNVRGIDRDLLVRIAPFVHVDRVARPPRYRVRFEQRTSKRIEAGAGYRGPDSLRAYAGGPYRQTTRLTANLGDRLTLFALGDKDPGEPWIWEAARRRFGYDYLAAGIELRTAGPVRRLVAGTLDARFGLGLWLWTGGRFASLWETPERTVSRLGSGIRSAASTAEAGHLRGAAVHVRLPGPFQATVIASAQRLDATMTEAPDAGVSVEPAIRSLLTSGLHRTVSERLARRATTERFAAAHVGVGRDMFAIGLGLSAARLTHPLAHTRPLYQRLREDGSDRLSASLHGAVALMGFEAAFEAAVDPSGDRAAALGASLDVGPRTRLALFARRYAAAYWQQRGAGIGRRQGPPWNERGIFWTIVHRFGRSGRARWGIDVHSFPGPRYDGMLPSRGTTMRWSVEHNIAGGTSIRATVRHRSEDVRADQVDDVGRTIASAATRRSLQSSLTVQARTGRRVITRSRLTAARSRRDGAAAATGLLIYHEVRWSPLRSLRLSARIQLQESTGADVMIASAEADLLGAPSRSAFTGVGERMYVLVDFRPATRARIRLKGSLQKVAADDVLGSGYEAIDGPRLRELRAQLILEM